MSKKDDTKAQEVNWWYVAGGFILAFCGIVALVSPSLFMAYLTIFAGAGFLLSGFAGLISYWKTRHYKDTSKANLIMAILDIIVGILLIAYPFALEGVVPWFLGVVFILFGILEIIGVMPFAKFQLDSRAIMVIAGILAIIVGVLFIVWPESLSLWIAAFALVRGITLVAVGFTER